MTAFCCKTILGPDNGLSFLSMVHNLFENIRGHLRLSQFQALPNDYLQMCRKRIVHN